MRISTFLTTLGVIFLGACKSTSSSTDTQYYDKDYTVASERVSALTEDDIRQKFTRMLKLDLAKEGEPQVSYSPILGLTTKKDKFDLTLVSDGGSSLFDGYCDNCTNIIWVVKVEKNSSKNAFAFECSMIEEETHRNPFTALKFHEQACSVKLPNSESWKTGEDTEVSTFINKVLNPSNSDSKEIVIPHVKELQ